MFACLEVMEGPSRCCCAACSRAALHGSQREATGGILAVGKGDLHARILHLGVLQLLPGAKVEYTTASQAVKIPTIKPAPDG